MAHPPNEGPFVLRSVDSGHRPPAAVAGAAAVLHATHVVPRTRRRVSLPDVPTLPHGAAAIRRGCLLAHHGRESTILLI